jgi:cardiolipin synthase
MAAASSLATLFVARNFFPTEKKVRHPIRADYDVGDDVFVRTMGHLLGPPLVKGNTVTPLENGDHIFPAMLSGIRSAQRTITFENFLFQEGEISDAFAQALAERARAGVSVHFLQDALGCDSVHGRAIQLMKRAGVAVEIFRFVHFSRINYRTHRKILVIDGALGFIGGVGIADAWKGNGRTKGLWRDSHYEVRGPVVAQLQEAFMDNWLETRAELLHGDLYFPKQECAGEQMCQIFKSSAGEGSDSARLMLLVSIAAARDRIRIANAYFIPDNLTIQTLLERSTGALRWKSLRRALTSTRRSSAPWARRAGRLCSKPVRAFTSISLRDSTANICLWMTAGHRSAPPISTIARCH